MAQRAARRRRRRRPFPSAGRPGSRRRPTPHRPARSRAGSAARTAATRSWWPGRVLRQAAAPAHDARLQRLAAHAGRLTELGAQHPGEFDVGAREIARRPGPPGAAPHDHAVETFSNMSPFRGQEGRRLDQPALGGGHQKAAGFGKFGVVREDEGGQRDAGVRRARAPRRPAVRAACAPARSARRAPPRRSVSPSTRQPSPSRSRSVTGLPRTTSAPLTSASRCTSCPMPSTGVAKTGCPVGFGASRWAACQQRALLERRDELGRGHPQRQLVGATRVDAAEQGIDEPIDHPIAEPRPDVRADRRILLRSACAGSTRSSSARAVPRTPEGRRGCAQIAGDAEQRARRQLLQLAVQPEPGGDGGRMGELQPGLARRRRSLRAAGTGTPRRPPRRRAGPCAACRRPARSARAA